MLVAGINLCQLFNSSKYVLCSIYDIIMYNIYIIIVTMNVASCVVLMPLTSACFTSLKSVIEKVISLLVMLCYYVVCNCTMMKLNSTQSL